MKFQLKLNRHHYLFIFAFLIIVFSLLIDPFVSRLFFNSQTMSFQNGQLVRTLRILAHFLILAFFFPLLLLFRPTRPSLKLLSFPLLVFIVGTGLIVNGVFKSFWNRPRPRETQLFTGSLQFVPPFVFCPNRPIRKNASFPSGEASVGFAFFGFLPLFRRRRSVLLISIIFGCAIGLIRIVQGAHFLSDVFFSGFFLYYTTYFLEKFYLRSSS